MCMGAGSPPISPISEEQYLSHPLWTPPTLCGDSQALDRALKFPGEYFCPPVRVTYFRQHMAAFSPPVPDNYWMLDAPAFMSVLSKRANLSKWLVNIGANPSSTGEDGERRPIQGDDCSALWRMGYRGLNFDVPENARSMAESYAPWPGALVDAGGHPPWQIGEALRRHGVPRDIDFLKIDVDSFDCEFLGKVLAEGYRPKVVMIESAPYWPPPIKYITRYSDSHPYSDARPSALMGCSLSMVLEVLSPYGYTLIQYAMEDAWFVKSEFEGLFGKREYDPWKVFAQGNPNLYAAHQFRGPKGTNNTLQLMGLISLRAHPEKMLQRARELVEQVLEWRPSLNQVKYELSI